ncbi:MAG: glycosyltransferase family 1 protein [Microthrixaceae bacterium]
MARNGSPADVRRAVHAAWGNSWPFVRRNVVGKVRRLQRPNTDIARRWVLVWGATKAALPATVATRFGGRWRRVGAEPTDRVGSRLLRRSAPRPPRPDPDGPTVVFVDVTDTLASRWRAGIQRAVSELVTRLMLHHPEVSVVPMRWSALDGRYRRLDGAETEALFDPEAMPNHPPAPVAAHPPAWRRAVTRVGAVPAVRRRIDEARRVRALRRRPAHHADLLIEAFPAGSTLLDLDATWNLDDAPRSRVYPRLRDEGVRVISLLHDVLPVTHPDWFDPNLARVFQSHVGAALDHADAVVTSSAFSAGEIAGLAARAGRSDLEIRQIALGADPVARAAQPPDTRLLGSLDGRAVILAVGTLEPRKNHAGLLDAFDRMAADTTLVVVGRQGWQADDVADRLRSHPGFGDRIRWPAEVNDATLDALYELAEVVAVPSHAEGYGLPVVEALRRGCRVVSSTGGSLPEVGGEDVTYVDATDATAFAAALDSAVGHTDPPSPQPFPTWDDSAAALAAILTGRDLGSTTGPPDAG